MGSAYVLDASALLAWLNGEPGGENVEPLLDQAAISTVNLSEVLQKGLAAGADITGLTEDLEALGLEFVDFTATEAGLAAELWPETRHLALSLADRACLSTAGRLQSVAVTADRDWNRIGNTEISVRIIR